jgi:hypothetical protein
MHIENIQSRLLDRKVLDRSCIVHQHIDPRPLADDSINDSLWGRRFIEVGWDCQRLAS